MTAPFFRGETAPSEGETFASFKALLSRRSRASIAPRWVRHDAGDLPARIV